VADCKPIEACKLTKCYGDFEAVKGVDFEVSRGECVALLGPNGAGKTTTIRMLTCFSPITDGVIRVFGHDVSGHPRLAKSMMGICPQEDNLDPDFTVQNNLLVFARYFGIEKSIAASRVDQLLKKVGLTEKADSSIIELSGGMKRRLMIARALLNEPRLLVMDEPTTGLDPQARQLVWQLVRRLSQEGVTVLLSTHYMEEASQLADRVIVMDGGNILLEGEPEKLVQTEVGCEVVELWNMSGEVVDFFRQEKWPMEQIEGRLYIYDRVGGEVAGAIISYFPEQKRQIRQATLEDVFLRRTGRVLRD
jgi:lipooligosaccharide transport system ATP-binding protein